MQRENKSSWDRKDDGDGDNDGDPDDRKPPAKEVVVINRQNKQQHDNDDSSPRSTEDTAEASIVSSSNASFSASSPGVEATAHSPASLSSSPAYSPVAASPKTPTACMVPPRSSVMTLSSPTPNIEKKQQMPPSPSSLVDRLDETVANLADTSHTVMNALVRLLQQLQSSSCRSRQQQVALLLMSTTIVSTMAFICCILSTTALIAISIATASFGLLLQHALHYAVQEFNSRVENGRGLSELFNLSPESSLWQTLTRTTLHEYMTDDSFAMEYRYLLLYFIPGITPQQLNAYIDRLDPRHRDLLRRPGGIGQALLGPTAMRAIMGRRPWEALIQQAQQQQQQPHESPLLLQQNQQRQSTTTTPLVQQQLLEMQDRQSMEHATPARALFHHRDMDDDDSSNCSCSDLGLDVTANDLAGGLSESQATRMARQLGLVTMMTTPPPTTAITETPKTVNDSASSSPAAATAVVVAVPTSTSAAAAAANEEDDEQQNLDRVAGAREEAVVTDAFWSSYNYFYDMAMGAMRDAIIPSRRTVVRSSITGLGIGISVPAVTLAAAGIYNFWASGGSIIGTSSRSSSSSGTSGGSSTLTFLSRLWSQRGGNDTSRSNLWATTLLLGSGVTGVVIYAAYSRSSSSSTNGTDEEKKK
jgi:hypothetical protein